MSRKVQQCHNCYLASVKVSKFTRAAYRRAFSKKYVRELSDNYVKQLIGRRMKLPYDEIPTQLIEAKRAQILLFRECYGRNKS